MNEISDFINRHGLSENAEIDRIEGAVLIFNNFYSSVMKYMETYEPPTKRHELLSEVYGNIVGRLQAHVSGMLVCLATRNAASAEAIARTVLETSVNLIFMLQGDRERAFLGYCDDWFSSHERQLNQWLEYEKKLNEKTVNLEKIKERMEMLDGQKMIVDMLVSNLGMSRCENYREAYPKSLFSRFEKTGKEGQYFTSYHRLSNSSHVLAEDTISWLLAKMDGDHARMLSMCTEAVAYSQMMCLIVMVTAIESIGIFAIAHNHLECVALMQEGRKRLVAEIEKLSVAAGVPQS